MGHRFGRDDECWDTKVQSSIRAALWAWTLVRVRACSARQVSNVQRAIAGSSYSRFFHSISCGMMSLAPVHCDLEVLSMCVPQQRRHCAHKSPPWVRGRCEENVVTVANVGQTKQVRQTEACLTLCALHLPCIQPFLPSQRVQAPLWQYHWPTCRFIEQMGMKATIKPPGLNELTREQRKTQRCNPANSAKEEATWMGKTYAPDSKG